MKVISQLNIYTKLINTRNKRITFFSVILFLIPFLTFGQNDSCADAEPFCSNSGLSFPANSDGTGSGNGPQADVLDPGNNYGCLSRSGNPAWFYLQIGVPSGNIDIDLSNSNGVDIDFALWGPFANLATATANCGSLPTPTDCSYSSSATETVNVPGSNTGDVYLMVITNYANTPTDISAFQTGGTGVTDCNIIPTCAELGVTVGTFNVTPTPNASSEIILCQGDSWSSLTNDDYVLPPGLDAPGIGNDTQPELMYAIYHCPPPATPDFDMDPCFSGLFWTGDDFLPSTAGGTNSNTGGGVPDALATALTNAGVTVTGQSIWFIPVTADDGDNDNSNSLGVDNLDDDCFESGTPIEVIYLENVDVTFATSCDDPVAGTGSVEVTISGGGPGYDPSTNFTILGTGVGVAASPTTVPDGGTTVIGPLSNGQTVSLTLTDDFGCDYGPYTFNFKCENDACLIDSEIRIDPPVTDFPNNQYPPGTEVTFCFDVNKYRMTNTNFIQAIVADYDPLGWEPGSFTIISNPVTASPGEQVWGSEWIWEDSPTGVLYNDNIPDGTLPPRTDVAVNAEGAWIFHSNVFSNTPAGSTNPNNEFGDGCVLPCNNQVTQTACENSLNGTWIPGCGCSYYDHFTFFGGMTQNNCNNLGGEWLTNGFNRCRFLACQPDPTGNGFDFQWTACFSLTTAESCSPSSAINQNLGSVKFTTYADGEIGGWTEAGCRDDLPVTNEESGTICCIPPPIAPTPVLACEETTAVLSASPDLTMPPVPDAICTYLLDLRDTIANNGWNGASIDVIVNGTVAYTFSPGNVGSDRFGILVPITMNHGDNFQIEYSPGFAGNAQNSYSLIDHDDMVIHTVAAGPGGPPAGISFTGVASCPLPPPVPVNYEINWYLDPDGLPISSGSNTLSLDGLSPGTYTYYAEQSNNGCLSDKSVVSLVVQPLPTATFNNFEKNICLGESITMTATAADGTIISWTGEGTSGSGTTQTVTPTFSQTYTVTLNSTLGCNSVTIPIPITVFPVITADAGPDMTLCEGQTAHLGALGIPGTGDYTYEWDNGLGAGNAHTVTVGSTNVTYNVTVTGSNGCTAIDEVTVISTANANPVITCPADQNVLVNAANCEATVILEEPIVTDDCAPAILTGANGVILNYYGTYNGHYYYVTDQDVAPGSIPGTSTEMQAFAAVQTTAQEFGTDGYIITVNDAAENNYLTNIGYHYGNLLIGFTDEQTEGVFGWFGGCCGEGGTGYTNWNTGDGQPDNTGNQDYVEIQISNGTWNDRSANASPSQAVVEFNTMPEQVMVVCTPSNPFPVGTTTVTCTATDWSGLTNQCTYDITVTSDLTVDAGNDLTLCEGQTAHLGAFSLGSTPSYVWDNGLGAGSTHTVTVGNSNMTYTVTVTDSNGCTATDQVTIMATANANPVITCPPNQSEPANAANCEANVVLPEPTATDDCAPPSITAANGVSMTYYGTYNGHYYYITDQDVAPGTIPGAGTQAQAFAEVQNAAQEFGNGYVVTVDDANENTFLTNIGYHYGNLLIGYTDEQAEGTFGWFGGCCGEGGSGYLNWNTSGGEPNNIGNEDYVEIQITDGTWNDISASASPTQAIVEFNTMPEQVTFVCTPSSPFPLGTTTITCTATDWFGLSDQCTYDITVTSDLAANAGQDLTLCESHTAYLGATGLDGTPPYTYAWSNGSTMATQSVTVGASSTSYIVTVTDANGCTAADDITVFSTVNADPVFDNCPSTDITGDNSTTGSCNGTVNLPILTATDDCALPVIISANGLSFNYNGFYNGHYYYVSTTPITLGGLGVGTEEEALAAVNDAAVELGGYLATIEDATENEFATGLSNATSGGLFIGYTDEQTECSFGWFGGCCGAPGTGYNNWALDPAQPDDGGTPCDGGGPNAPSNVENYTEILPTGEWNDFSLTSGGDYYALIEVTTLTQQYPEIVIDCSPGNPFPVGTTTVNCTATDWAGNQSTCDYDVIILDVIDPIILPPSDIIIEDCDITALDNYSDVAIDITADSILYGYNVQESCNYTVTYVDSQINDCPIVITRTFTVTDASGNIDQEAQTITIDDTVLPTITVPGTSNIEGCDVSALTDYSETTVDITPDSIAYGYNVLEACDYVVTYIDIQSSACPTIVTRTFTVTDDCGNSQSEIQIININDTVDPTITAPATRDVEGCTIAALTDYSETAMDITADSISYGYNVSEACVYTVSYIDSQTGNCPIVVTRTFTVTDLCGNSTNTIQTISVDDRIDPTITVAATSNVEGCDITALTDYSETAMDISADSISYGYTVSEACVYTVSYIDSQTGNCPIVVTRTFTVMDLCGNTTDAIQTISIDDTVAPTITAPATNNIEGCDITALADYSETAVDITALAGTYGYAAADACNYTVSYTDSQSGACPIVVTRVFTATDLCGNTTDAIQTISIDDTIDPTITIPGPINIEACGIGDLADYSETPVNITADSVSYGYNVSEACNYTVSYVDSRSGSCPVMVIRTFTVTDDCGNAQSETQTISVGDTTAPMIAASATVSIESCDGLGGLPDYSTTAVTITADSVAYGFSVLEACNYFVSYMDSQTGNCPIEVTRTFTVTDACNYTGTMVQVISITDSTLPVIQAPAASDVEGCEIMDLADYSETPIDITADSISYGYTVSEACNYTVSYVDSQTGSCPIVVTRIYSVTDDCGNTASSSQTVTIIDTVDPIITIAATRDVEGCDIMDLADYSETAMDITADSISYGYTVSEACNYTVSYIDTKLDGCPIVVTRTFTVTDLCGRSTNTVQTINVEDTVDPTITAPATSNIEGCDIMALADYSEATVNITADSISYGYTVSEACGYNVSYIDSKVDGCPIVVTRTFTVTDLCGNTTDATQIINITDTVDPTITAPATSNLEGCDVTVLADYSETAMDITADSIAYGYNVLEACDYTVIYVDSQTGDCPIVVTRIFRVTDACGNTTNASQIINISDNIDPTITAPATSDIEGCDITALADYSETEVDVTNDAATYDYTANDACSFTVSYMDSQAGTCPIVVTRVFTVEDACGNTASSSQIINVNDTVAPVPVSPPANESYQCASDVPVIGDLTANDACDGVITQSSSTEIITPGTNANDYTIDRTWIFMDACMNEDSVKQTITVLDDTDPTITCPSDIVTNTCDEIIPVPVPTFDDNCTGATVSNDFNSTGDASGMYPVGTTTVVWTVTDVAGNTATCSMTVTVDAIPIGFIRD